ncbi:MAG: glycosyltransferase family 2 protein [Promethearchaeota archaeon]
MKSVSIVIPVHNEEKIIEENVKKLEKYLYSWSIPDFEIILIENGSTDLTLQIARRLEMNNTHVRVFTLHFASWGEALRKGFTVAEKETIITYPMDLTWSVEFIKNSLHLLERYPVVLGVRYFPASKVDRPFLRIVISRFHTVLVNFLFRTSFNDIDCLKAMRTTVGKQIVEKTRSYGTLFDVEVALLIWNSKISYKEIALDHIEPGKLFRHVYWIVNFAKHFFKIGMRFTYLKRLRIS